MPNQYDTSTMLEVVNTLDTFEPFLLNMFFPEMVNFATSKIEFDVIDEDMQLAPFVSPMVAGKADKANGGELRSFKPAYVKPKNVVDPERVIKRKAGEPIGGGTMSPDQKRNAIITDLLLEHQKKIMRRKEWMAAQALLTGKVTVEGEDYPKVEVDFKRDAGNAITLAGALTWDKANLATATPLEDVDAWGVLCEGPITKLVFDRLSWADFIRFQEVKDLMDTRRGSQSQLELGPDNGERDYSYKGMLGADIECWVYSGYYKDETGVKQNYMPDNTVIAGSAAVQGVRAHGAILDGEAGYQALDFFPKNWVQKDPAVEYVMSQSAPLMIPKRPNAIVTVTTK